MKQVKGTWVPDADTYFQDNLDDNGDFQIDRLEAALDIHAKRPGRRIRQAVDVGAHVGTWARRMSRCFTRVMAFEPASDTYECLTANVGMRANITALQVGLGHRVDFMSVSDDLSRPGNTGSRYLTTSSQDVLVVPLDHLRLPFIDLLKLDVEGFELNVLKGAKRSLLKDRPTVIMEVKNLGRGVDPELAHEELVSYGARQVAAFGKDRIYIWGE